MLKTIRCTTDLKRLPRTVVLVALSLLLLPSLFALPAAQASPASFTNAREESNPRMSPHQARSELDQDIERTSAFMRHTESGEVYFDEEAAKAAGASPDTLEIGGVVNDIARANRDDPDPGMASAQLSLPVWGNWCGPGHGGGDAVDVLDSICRTHDNCYGTQGYFACSCDRAIVADIRKNAHRMGTGERTVAAAVSTYFTYSLCNPLS